MSIKGDMQQAYAYKVLVTGAKGKGGIVYCGKEYKSGETVYVTQFFTVADVVTIDVDGYTAKISLDAKSNTIKLEYKR